MAPTPHRPSRFRALGEGLFLLVLGAMLALPLLGHLLGRQAAQSDNRALAAAPHFPTSWEAATEWPRHVDAYLSDHFGFRRELVDLAAKVRWHALGSSSASSIVMGRNGRIFFSEGDVPMRVVLGSCGAWWPEARNADIARQIGEGLAEARRSIPTISILVVPTSPVLYPQDLPRWVARACAGHLPEAENIRNRLPAPLRPLFAYPRDLAAELPAATPLVPPHNFHWDGVGIDEFMGRFAEREMGLSRQASPARLDMEKAADLALYVPGVNLSNRIQAMDWSRYGARSCFACDLPPFDGLTLPNETIRLQRDGGGGRLLLVGDSFTAGGANGLLGYFADIITINLNNIQRLTPEERRQLWDRLTAAWQPDRALLLINDGNTDQLPHYLDLLREASAPAP